MVKFFLITLFGSATLVLLTGFRPFAHDADQMVEHTEQTFKVRSHAELYIMVRVERDGAVETDRWLLMYEYDDNATRGLWHILPSEGKPATTLLSVQWHGKATELYLRDGEKPVVKVEGSQRQQAFGMTDWNLEDIYDDDKHGWRHRQVGTAKVRGIEAIVIESHYSDPVLRDSSYYDKRRSYLAAQDKRFLRSDYYGVGNSLIKSVQADHHEDVSETDEQRIRAKRLEILDYRDGSITIMVRVKSAFNIDLPREWFTREFLEQWGGQTDQEILALID